MIPVTRLNGEQYWINAMLVESVEQSSDTFIKLVTGKKVVVQEDSQKVIELIKLYHQGIGVRVGAVQVQQMEGLE